jgi:hypothetical protein
MGLRRARQVQTLAWQMILPHIAVALFGQRQIILPILPLSPFRPFA